MSRPRKPVPLPTKSDQQVRQARAIETLYRCTGGLEGVNDDLLVLVTTLGSVHRILLVGASMLRPLATSRSLTTRIVSC